MNAFRRCVASLLVVSLASPLLSLPAQAALVATDSVAARDRAPERARIAAFLARGDVREQLVARGVSPADVRARIDALSDEEAVQLAGRIDSLPAAGADILGVALIVFLVLLLTDILGLTKVFPFTKPMK